MESKWAYLNDKIEAIFKDNPSEGYVSAAKKLIGSDSSSDIDLLRTYIKRYVIRHGLSNVSSSETVDYTGGENVVGTDAFKRYCKAEGLDINKVKSAKYVNHDGQQKFNVVLDYTPHNEIDWDVIVDALSDRIEPTILDLPKAENKLALHLYHSDLHIGADVSDTSIYTNNYNLSVLESRLFQVRSLALKKKIDCGVFDTLVMFDLGDLVDGQDGYTTRGGHKMPQNLNNIGQFEGAIKAYKNHIAGLVGSNIANKYVFYATINDNHSYLLSYYALRALSEWCSFAYPQVEVIIQDKFIDTYEYGIHTFMISHGKDKEFMKTGMPKYLDKKTEIFIKDYIDYHGLSGSLHFVKGDLHQDCIDFCNRFRYRNCLSAFGSSEWIHTNIGYGRAGLSYDIVSKNSKDINEGRIFFQ